MNLVTIRRNIALFLVAVIVIILAFRIAVAFIEVILLAVCLAVIIFFGFAEDIKTTWATISTGMQEAYKQWQGCQNGQSTTQVKQTPEQYSEQE